MLGNQFLKQEFELIEYIFSGFGASIEGMLTCNFRPVNRFLLDANLFSPFLITYLANIYTPASVYMTLQEIYPGKLKDYSKLPKTNKDDLELIFKQRMLINCTQDDVLSHIDCITTKLEKSIQDRSSEYLLYNAWEPLLCLCKDLPSYFDKVDEDNCHKLQKLMERLHIVKRTLGAGEQEHQAVKPSVVNVHKRSARKRELSAKEIADLGHKFDMTLYLYNLTRQARPCRRSAGERKRAKSRSFLGL